jgi:histidinol phosphatase-like PHP family hydrolase
VAIEINGGPALDKEYRRAMQPFYGLAREMGARFTVTADAHHPNDLERLDLALWWARVMGVKDRELLAVEELLAQGPCPVKRRTK